MVSERFKLDPSSQLALAFSICVPCVYALCIIAALGCEEREAESAGGGVASGEMSGEMGGEMGGETSGEMGGEMSGEMSSNEVEPPRLIRCVGDAHVELTPTSGVLTVSIEQDGAPNTAQLTWVDEPLSRLAWREGATRAQDPLIDPLPQVEVRCVDPNTLNVTKLLERSEESRPETEDTASSPYLRRLVSAPVAVVPRVVQFNREGRWAWRRDARLALRHLKVPSSEEAADPHAPASLPELELWWWPLRGEVEEDTSLTSLLGAPKRIMLRDPSGRMTGIEADELEGDVDLAFNIDEWGVYAVLARTETPPPRIMTYRAIAGISMGGGGAAQIGSRHPELFDYVGAMGGPSDWIYMLHYVTDRLLAGFCEGEEIGMFCGTGPVTQPLEQYSDFLNFIYSNNGSDFDRGQYMKIFQDVVFALGNPTVFNPESPYLPPTVSASELLRSRRDRCKPECRGDDCDPVEEWVKIPQFYDDQFNPTGEWPVILFCDGETGDGAQGVWAEGPHRVPTELFLAVDLNDNGRRDVGEPIIKNLSETFEDVGCDGLSSEDEEGYDPLYNPDPAGDDFHWLYNPFGTEGDRLFEGAQGDIGLTEVSMLPETVLASDRDALNTIRRSLERLACADGEPGEPFEDYGLDGVMMTPQIAEGGFDWGEGNGSFDYNPNKISYIASTPSLWLARALELQGGGPRYWIDGGIRDVMNFVVAGMYLAGRLHHLSPRSVTTYESFERLLGREPFVPNFEDSYRFDRLGEHVFLRYGDLDATPEEIEAHDGGHVGSDVNAMSRLNGALHWMVRGWQRALGDQAPRGTGSPSQLRSDSVDSPIFGGRYHFEVVLPPGYDDPENAEQRYPVIYLLHGYGQRARGLAIANVFFGGMMATGIWPGVIFVYPDGACSDMVQVACNDGVDNDGDGLVDLDDPTCDGDERARTERDEGDSSPRRCADGVDNDRDGLIDLADPGCLSETHDDEGECREGTFYLNHVVGVDGVSRGRDYEGAFLDMIQYVDTHYRTLR